MNTNKPNDMNTNKRKSIRKCYPCPSEFGVEMVDGGDWVHEDDYDRVADALHDVISKMNPAPLQHLDLFKAWLKAKTVLYEQDSLPDDKLQHLIGKRVYLNNPSGYNLYSGIVRGRVESLMGSTVYYDWVDVDWETKVHPCTNPIEVMHIRLAGEQD